MVVPCRRWRILYRLDNRKGITKKEALLTTERFCFRYPWFKKIVGAPVSIFAIPRFDREIQKIAKETSLDCLIESGNDK
jgi:hypothetical protein